MNFYPIREGKLQLKWVSLMNLFLIVGAVIWKLFNIFQKYDATIAEINPLVVTARGDHSSRCKT